MRSYIDIPTRKLNRLNSRMPKVHKRFWCDKCDRNLVHMEDKCEVCGHVHNDKKMHKNELP